MTRVKICGLMTDQDVKACVQAGVHMVGFVVDYPTSVPWNLTVEEARKLIQNVPPFVSTCVVTGGSVDKILGVVEKTRPNVVQLHYKEKLSEVSEIADQLQKDGIKTIKALRIDKDGNCDFEIKDPTQAVEALSNTGISALLVDTYTESMPGGTGVLVNLSTFQMIQKQSSLPVIMAGGLKPTNIKGLIGEVHPYAVDVLTGVEEKPGQKNVDKIFQFVSSCRDA
ncbi:phosphoribosylanthranilate isomerase [Bacillus sp. B15-48]|uniref:phosphoribosylanthranilate isomerase n=1 Tax=Bacillus sp. B15-48 TaxID=1548601 RepID=UPI00193F3815|nr:phosphoribosylanthranilate isomerase [Bacillus sp. B15-48]MBM4761790.1 phosphoribosylanthranilate isomerase [Bacillus sp. B15-48]